MKKKVDLFIDALANDWYIQGLNAYPIFLNVAAISGFQLKNLLGYGYTSILYQYKNGYCEMHYSNRDFKTIWRMVKKHLRSDPYYVEKLKLMYEAFFSQHEKLFKKIDQLHLEIIDDTQLLLLLKKLVQAQIDSVGVAHVLEPISIGLESEFKTALHKELGDEKEFNRYSSLLTTPSKRSFLAQEENELRRVAKIGTKQAYQSHLKKYFWVQNSFAGPTQMDEAILKNRAHLLSSTPNRVLNKDKLAATLHLSNEILDMISLVDYCTIWQDERKRNAIKTVGYLGKVIEEIAKRTQITKEALYYLGINDVAALTSFADIVAIQPTLSLRKQGTFILQDANEELLATGKEYAAIVKHMQKGEKHEQEQEIRGFIASMGTAVGRVAICTDLQSIYKVQAGDVIVASMTRPEYTPALRKAVAIITDEGGITCHAAIISRELKIPAIVGTRIATKVLHDGMQVEVRANHGFVRILS